MSQQFSWAKSVGEDKVPSNLNKAGKGFYGDASSEMLTRSGQVSDLIDVVSYGTVSATQSVFTGCIAE